MKKPAIGDDQSRREYLRTLGLLGVVGIGTTDTVQANKACLNPGNERSGETLYAPPEGAPVPGAMYPRIERLEHSPGGNDTLLATFEYYSSMSGGSQPYFPVYRSTNGGQTWSKFSEIHDQSGKDWGLRYQPTLYELPEETGPWLAGTVLAAGNAIPIVDDPSDVPEAQPVRWQGVRALIVDRRMVLDEFELAAAVRRSHHHYLRLDTIKPVDLVHPLALDQRPALALKSQIEEERNYSIKIIDDNTDMIETQHSHISHSFESPTAVR